MAGGPKEVQIGTTHEMYQAIMQQGNFSLTSGVATYCPLCGRSLIHPLLQKMICMAVMFLFLSLLPTIYRS